MEPPAHTHMVVVVGRSGGVHDVLYVEEIFTCGMLCRIACPLAVGGGGATLHVLGRQLPLGPPANS